MMVHRGESTIVQQGRVFVAAWLDRKPVIVMASNVDPTAVSTVQRRMKDGSRKSFACPEAIIAYNKFMGGVDRGDQLRGYYRYQLKTRKFYRYIFFFLCEVAITNAYALFKQKYSTTKNLKEFRLHLAKQLIGDYCSRRRPGRVSCVIRTLPFRHFPIQLPRDKPSQRKRGRCAHCFTTHKKRSDTQWFCRECSVWLCHTGGERDCFLLWHKKHLPREN